MWKVRRVHDGTYSPVTTARMDAVFDAWDDDAVAGGLKFGTLKPSTARSYRSMVRTHLAPAFGKCAAFNSRIMSSRNGAVHARTTLPLEICRRRRTTIS